MSRSPGSVTPIGWRWRRASDRSPQFSDVFRQGFGDLFVVRVAGNVVAPSLIGSIEFAATQFGTRLVVVLGHTNCGAVTATVEARTQYQLSMPFQPKPQQCSPAMALTHARIVV